MLFKLLILTCASTADAVNQTLNLNILQWNIHWECFIKSPGVCGPAAEVELTRLLTTNEIDIASVIELDDPNYVPPAGYAKKQSTMCGQDIVTILWKTDRLSFAGSATTVCMDPTPDRPALIMSFSSAYGEALTVVGAHYPHPGYQSRQKIADTTSLRNALASIRPVGKVLLVADTNVFGATNKEIFQDLGINSVIAGSDERFHTCCVHDGFYFLFDRIIANFGTMTSRMAWTDTPAWATAAPLSYAASSMHRPLVGTLTSTLVDGMILV
eukprot:TRINITY_DN6460_c0_g1_i1.p1 TRINITY_DN6460_c0_g1~~TRINITY_DN6460_c0_g1_i1.p1  ORF type:complete len:270 (+),score=36.47 TRINITY_DN6460_c0_g1_i1:56-865(+)